MNSIYSIVQASYYVPPITLKLPWLVHSFNVHFLSIALTAMAQYVFRTDNCSTRTIKKVTLFGWTIQYFHSCGGLFRVSQNCTWNILLPPLWSMIWMPLFSSAFKNCKPRILLFFLLNRSNVSDLIHFHTGLYKNMEWARFYLKRNLWKSSRPQSPLDSTVTWYIFPLTKFI